MLYQVDLKKDANTQRLQILEGMKYALLEYKRNPTKQLLDIIKDLGRMSKAIDDEIKSNNFKRYKKISYPQL